MKAQDVEAAIEKLEAHLAKAPDFSASEVAELHKMIDAFRGWQQLGRAAKWLIVTLGLIAGGLTAATVLAGNVRSVLKSWLA